MSRTLSLHGKEKRPSDVVTVASDQIASFYVVGRLTSSEATRIHLKNGQSFSVIETPEQVAWLLEASMSKRRPKRKYPQAENEFKSTLQTALAGLAPLDGVGG